MKQITLILAFAVIGITASAQDKAPARPKQTYQVDLKKPVEVKITPTVRQLDDFLEFLRKGESLSKSNDISAARYTEIMQNAATVSEQIGLQFTKFLKDDQDKFTADTLKANKLATIKTKPK